MVLLLSLSSIVLAVIFEYLRAFPRFKVSKSGPYGIYVVKIQRDVTSGVLFENPADIYFRYRVLTAPGACCTSFNRPLATVFFFFLSLLFLSHERNQDAHKNVRSLVVTKRFRKGRPPREGVRSLGGAFTVEPI